MSLYRYFKQKSSETVSNDPTLPSPDGPLSKKIPSSIIEAANNKVAEVKKQDTAASGSDKAQKIRGTYEKYSPEKAKVANYAIQHGTAVAIRNFRNEHHGVH